MFLFFFTSFRFVLGFVRGRLYWYLAFAASLASFMTHPMQGIFSMFLLFGTPVFRKTMRTFQRVAGFAALARVLPLVVCALVLICNATNNKM